MPQWPATLSQCPILGWGETVTSNTVEFDPDAGFPRRRRRSTVRAYEVSVAYKLRKADLATFWDFYETNTADGTLPFDWPHPRNNGALASVVFLDPPSVGQMANNVYTLTLKLRLAV